MNSGPVDEENEKLMAQIRHFPGSGLRAAGQSVALRDASSEPSAANTEKYCVYNQTRERFVATEVESADASTAALEARLRTLERAGGTGLWICPYLGIAPTSVRFPVDLVYLNNDCVVLETVESFPLSSPTVASAKALSALALPADTLSQGEIRSGDQLLIAAPADMKWHLQRIKEAKEYPLPFPEQSAGTSTEEPSSAAGEQTVRSLFALASQAQIEVVPAAPEIVPQEPPGKEGPAPAPPRVEPSPWKTRAKPKDWLTRLLRGDEEPEDPRIAAREALPGLSAYYFTGGTPAAQEVRDISPTGLYIVTSERWYPGTVVRLTLTDRHNPIVERSLTVNAKAVRFGSDGVGLEFILNEEKKRRDRDPQLPEQSNGVDIAKVLEFLRNYKSPAPPI